MLKELCNCGEVAVWDYLPGFSSGSNSYFCDDCVCTTTLWIIITSLRRQEWTVLSG